MSNWIIELFWKWYNHGYSCGGTYCGMFAVFNFSNTSIVRKLPLKPYLNKVESICVISKKEWSEWW
jgi:hypothetical protein